MMMVLGQPETETPRPLGPGGKETPQIPRELREGLERSTRAFPMGAEDLIEKLQTVEIGEQGNTEALEKVFFDALAYRDGLLAGPKGEAYRFNPQDPKDRQKIAYLGTIFTTIEGATSRPYAGYLDLAIDEALSGRIRRAQEWYDNPQDWYREAKKRFDRTNRTLIRAGEKPIDEEEIQNRLREEAEVFSREFDAIPRLVELQSHVAARRSFDTAFIHRMSVCEDDERASQLGIKIASVTPDGSQWVGYLLGEKPNEFGPQLNSVLEEMVKFALPEKVVTRLELNPIPKEVRKQVPEEVYAIGFENAVMFGTWLKHLSDKTNGRMDVVFNAWKLMLTVEIADKLGVRIDEKGSYALASTPIGSALMNWLAHLNEKRRLEFGLKAKTSDRFMTEKLITHSGLPMSIDRIPDLCRNFFEESKTEFDRAFLLDREGKVKSWVQNLLKYLPVEDNDDYDPRYKDLKDNLEACLTQKKGPSGKIIKENVEIPLWHVWLYGRLSIADNDFPWYQTEQPSVEAAPGELPPGSFGGWLLRRFRAYNFVLRDIRSVPPLAGGPDALGDPNFFSSRLRFWVKVLGNVKEDELPENNPRAFWVMGLIQYHLGKVGANSPIVKSNPEKDYRTVMSNQELSRRLEALEEGGVGIGDVFKHATECGFLRTTDVEWIRDRLNISLR